MLKNTSYRSVGGQTEEPQLELRNNRVAAASVCARPTQYVWEFKHRTIYLTAAISLYHKLNMLIG